MKIKTIENLEDKLTEDLTWRKKEIFDLKLLLAKEDGLRGTLVRVNLALLCAHFEGFIKDASNDYIEFVANQKLLHNELKENFSVITMHKFILECAKSEKHSIQARVLQKYDEISLQPFCVKDKQIDTHSNPSSNVLKEILLTLGIKSDIFNLKSKYIDGSLLANRHKIVHGERCELGYDDFIETFHIILNLLDEYKDLVIDAAANQLYKRENNGTIL